MGFPNNGTLGEIVTINGYSLKCTSPPNIWAHIPSGAAGPTGPQGPTGPTGAQGPQGIQGNDGTSVTLTQVNDEASAGSTPGVIYFWSTV